jgi:hypothetical protein
MPYDYLYDPREAELGLCPVNNALPPPIKALAKFPNGKKTIGQVAMEADRDNVLSDPRMVKVKYFAGGGHVPTWDELTPYQQNQWERFALKIAKALIGEFSEEFLKQAREVEQKKLETEPKGKILELSE